MSTGIETSEVTKLRLTNPGKENVTFCLEPWARTYSLAPRTSLEVVFESGSPGIPEVYHEPDRIVVYAWPGATVRVLRDGVEFNEESQD